MRILSLLTLSFLVFLSTISFSHKLEAASIPRSFKIWGDEGNMLAANQTNVVCEIIELEYITKARSLSIVEVSIIDEEGLLMAKRLISSDGGNLHSKIGVNRWPAGLYTLKVWIDGEEQQYPLEVVKSILSK